MHELFACDRLDTEREREREREREIESQRERESEREREGGKNQPKVSAFTRNSTKIISKTS